MPDLPSRLDLFAIGRDFVVQRARKIDPAQVDIEGSDVNVVVGSGSMVADQVIRQLGYRTGALLLDGAEDEDLDRLVFDRYQITRNGASPAVVPVVITRPSNAAGAGTVAVGTRLSTSLGVEYVTTTTCSFGATDLSGSTCLARAAQAGKATQVGVGGITGFADAGSLFDRTLLATNVDPAAGGEDTEKDDAFRSRVRDFWRTARRGILAAIEFGALTVPGVVSAQAVEALTPGGLPARVVNLYIADSSGVANRALGDLVRSALEDFRAGGIAVVISTSLPQVVPVTLRLAFRANVDTLALTDNVRAAVVAFVNSIPVNGTLLIGQLFSVLQRYAEDGLIVSQGSIVAPVGDVVPSVGQTVRTTLADVTVVP